MSVLTKQKMDALIQAKKEEGRFMLGGPGFLQTFAGEDDDQDDDSGDDDDDSDDDSDDSGDDDQSDDDESAIKYERGAIDSLMKTNKLDFSQLLKDNPQLKKEYTDRFNKNMSKRMGKFADVDVDEYNDLKKRSSEGKLEGDAKDWKDKHDKLLVQAQESSKVNAIQHVAIDAKLDAEQMAFVSSMIKLNKIEQDDEGEWTGIEDEIERIQEKFPRMFNQKASDDDNDDSDKSDKKKKYNPGNKKHNQDSKTTDAKEKGRLRAQARHNKQ